MQMISTKMDMKLEICVKLLKTGLVQTAEGHHIVWPLVVIIENIRTGFDQEAAAMVMARLDSLKMETECLLDTCRMSLMQSIGWTDH